MIFRWLKCHNCGWETAYEARALRCDHCRRRQCLHIHSDADGELPKAQFLLRLRNPTSILNQEPTFISWRTSVLIKLTQLPRRTPLFLRAEDVRSVGKNPDNALETVVSVNIMTQKGPMGYLVEESPDDVALQIMEGLAFIRSGGGEPPNWIKTLTAMKTN